MSSASRRALVQSHHRKYPVYPPTTVKTHATKRSLELPSINLFAAVERALTAGDECACILMLLAVIRGGVNGLMGEILEDHIRTTKLR
jgi:hypothetical protein